MIFIAFLITEAKLNAVHEVEIINLRDPEWFLQLPIKHMANTKVGRVPDWLIGCEPTVEYCCDLSSLLTCCPLRWAALHPEAALRLPGPHPHEPHRLHHHQQQQR